MQEIKIININYRAINYGNKFDWNLSETNVSLPFNHYNIYD